MPIGPYDVGMNNHRDENIVVLRYIESIDSALLLGKNELNKDCSMIVRFDKNPFLSGIIQNRWIKE